MVNAYALWYTAYAKTKAPQAQPEADLTFPGIHLVELAKIRAMKGATPPDSRSDYGTRISFGLTGPAGPYGPMLKAPLLVERGETPSLCL
jgi:hypothetical protein